MRTLPFTYSIAALMLAPWAPFICHTFKLPSVCFPDALYPQLWVHFVAVMHIQCVYNTVVDGHIVANFGTNKMSTFTLRARLSVRQERRLKWLAEQQEKNMSEVVRALITALPEPPDDWVESDYTAQ